MSEQNVVTQAQLNAVYFYLNELADNLAAHANASLGPAHGFNFLHPVTFVDKYANTINGYLDDNDDTVGTHILIFNYEGVRYFCPAKLSSRAGQTAMSGLPTAITAYLAQVSGAGASNWVTEFAITLANYVSAMNVQYLLPHARLGYWEAHRNVTASSPDSWTDSAGHVTGTASVKIPIGGIVYKIPAKTTLQGTVKPWVGFELAADYKDRATVDDVTWDKNVYRHDADNSGNQDNPGQFSYFHFTERNASGTLPRALRLIINASQYGTSTNWLVIPPDSPSVARYLTRSLYYRRLSELFPGTWIGGRKMGVSEYTDLTCLDGDCSSTVTDKYMFSFNNDGGNDPLICRVMAIAYAIGTDDEKRYSFGNKCQFQNKDTDGDIFSDPADNTYLRYSWPYFDVAWTDDEFVESLLIGEVIPDEIAVGSLIWHDDDPLKP